ncbi:MAG: lysostaphin resistance A-like protein [Planctomycetaceae bacterium]
MEQFLFSAIVIAVCTASLAAWGGASRRWRKPEASPLPGCEVPRQPVPLGTLALVLACLGLFLLGPMEELIGRLLGWPPRPRNESTLREVQLNLAFDLSLVCVLISSLIAQRVPRASVGIRWDGIRRHFVESQWGFLLAIGPVFLVLLLSDGLGLRSQEPEHELLRMLVSDASWRNWLWIGATAVVAAPLAEELIFRVLFQGWLEELLPVWLAIGFSSLLFCFVHRFPDSLALLPLAVVLGVMQHQRRNYWSVVGIHALFNAFNLLLTGLSNGRF